MPDKKLVRMSVEIHEHISLELKVKHFRQNVREHQLYLEKRQLPEP